VFLGSDNSTQRTHIYPTDADSRTLFKSELEFRFTIFSQGVGDAGCQIIAVGQTLLEMKEMLPHGQFMDCVAAEFGWDRSWASQLMQIAEHFVNVDSSHHLPSSAKVLALLATL